MSVKPKFAWLVQVEEEYGQKRVFAHVVTPQENGELHSPSNFYRMQPGYEFADFRVSSYLGHSWSTFQHEDNNPGELWGLSHEFATVSVDRIERAKAMVSVFGKVARGLAKAEAENGYVRDGDFHAYLLRIGAALNIRTYYVRNMPRQLELTGEKFRKVTPATLQWWIGDVQSLAVENPSALVAR